MEGETTQLWIKQREEELESLRKEIEGWEAVIKKQRVGIANYTEEIQFIEELQNKEIGLYEAESGEKQLVEMKEELEGKKNSLEKTEKEWGEKIARSKNLEVYIGLAYRKKW